jgi:protein MpaA
MLLSTLFMSLAAALAPSASPFPSRASWEVIGRSGQGRPIRALRVGNPRARTKVMVVGAIHGNEPAGKAVIARLRRSHPPRGTALWLVSDANPDGAAAGDRHNAAGVDLNRNFPYRWRPQDGVYESGPSPASEPETQVMQRFIERERPRVTVWYHQALTMVVKSAGDAALERRYASRGDLPRGRLPAYTGTATSWQNHLLSGGSAFVVELPGGPLSPEGVRGHSAAVLSLAKAIAPPRSARAQRSRRPARSTGARAAP